MAARPVADWKSEKLTTSLSGCGVSSIFTVVWTQPLPSTLLDSSRMRRLYFSRSLPRVSLTALPLLANESYCRNTVLVWVGCGSLSTSAEMVPEPAPVRPSTPLWPFTWATQVTLPELVNMPGPGGGAYQLGSTCAVGTSGATELAKSQYRLTVSSSPP